MPSHAVRHRQADEESKCLHRVGDPGAERARSLSRRGMLAAGAAAWATFWRGAAPAGADEPPLRSTLSPLQRLVYRVTQGPTPADFQLAESLGYEGYLEYQLEYEAIDDSALQAKLAPLTTLTMEPYQLFALSGTDVKNELYFATLLRAIYSKRQLFERMVEFWTDHFNIDINNGADEFLKPIDDRDVIRVHALGTFPELLRASAYSPAMLLYLDNNVSTKLKPNENYSRELLELHTLGVDGGYVQKDVEEVARCFTGWTYYASSTAGVNRGKFLFNAANHDTGAKVVLGVNIPAGGGLSDGETVLALLGAHPSTQEFIAWKLCRWMWGYEPPQSLVDAVADEYAGSGGDIRAMLRVILSEQNMAIAPRKHKRPFHHFVSAIRGSGANLTAVTGVRNLLQQAGHGLFAWPAPDGYPDALEYWGGFVLPRWSFGASLTNSAISGLSFDAATFFAGAESPVDRVYRINQMLLGGQMTSAEFDSLLGYLLNNPTSGQKQRETVGLAIGSPTMQWY